MRPPPSDDNLYILQSISFSEVPVTTEIEVVLSRVQRPTVRRLAALIGNDAVFTVSPLVHVQLLSCSGSNALIHIVDGPERGRRGWVPSSWLHAVPSTHAKAV